MAKKKATQPKDIDHDEMIKQIYYALSNINYKITELNGQFTEFVNIMIPLLQQPNPDETAKKLGKIKKNLENNDENGGMFG